MKKVTVTIETLTSMFTKGNNGTTSMNRKSEFRITELKSLMRTIYREFFQFNDLQDMKNKEGELFGDLDKKSPVSFKLITSNKEIIKEGDKSKLKTVYHKNWTGHGIKKGTKITFKMYGRDIRKLDIYCKILILSSVFGSMGSRARKGLGSFRINNFDGDIDTKYNEWLEEEPLKILNSIKDDLADDFTLRTFKSPIEKISFTSYDNKKLNFPYIKNIFIYKINISLEDALLNISRLTHDRMDSKFIEKIQNLKVDKNILGSGNPRFSSPLWISCYSVNGSNYMIVKELNHDYMDFQNNEDNEKYIISYINDLEKIGGGTWQSYSE